MDKIDRRQFIKSSVIGTSCALLTSQAFGNIGRRADSPGRGEKKIIKRRLGRTGIELPVVSMGVMRADNPSLVRAALEAGMVHLDTAHGYQKGKNETMLGNLLKDYARESFVIATKVGADDQETFLSKFETSLQRLRMHYVDILYLHGVSGRDEALSPEMLNTMKKVKESGKARHVGLSTHKNEPEVIRAAVESGFYEVVLTAVNFKQDHYQEVKEAIETASEAGIGIIGMKTMAGAFHDKERTRAINCRAALKWVLQDQNVTTTIPGITSFEQLAENASVNQDLTLSEKEKADLVLGESEGSLYCQGCEQCIPQCRKALPIPDIMRAYMYTYGYGDSSMGHELLTALDVRANLCSDCDACSVRCAKGFQISERIADITRLAQVPAEFLS